MPRDKKSKRHSKKSSKRSKKNYSSSEDSQEDPMDQMQSMQQMQPMQQMNQMGGLQNPYNLEYDPLHINYITPQYNDLKFNNYGVSTDQLMNGNQMNSLSLQNHNMPQMGNSMQMQQPMMQQQMMQPMQQQMMQQMMPQMGQFGGMSEEREPTDTQIMNNQSGGSKYKYTRYLKKM